MLSLLFPDQPLAGGGRCSKAHLSKACHLGRGSQGAPVGAQETSLSGGWPRPFIPALTGFIQHLSLPFKIWLADVVEIGFPGGSDGKGSDCNAGDPGFDPLENGMATHSGILAWRIPWTEEPDGLQSMKWLPPQPTSARTEWQAQWQAGGTENGPYQGQPHYCSSLGRKHLATLLTSLLIRTRDCHFKNWCLPFVFP